MLQEHKNSAIKRRASENEYRSNMLFSPKTVLEKPKHTSFSFSQEKGSLTTPKKASFSEFNHSEYKGKFSKTSKFLVSPLTIETFETNEFSQSFNEGPTSFPPEFSPLKDFFQKDPLTNSRKKPKIFAETCKHSNFPDTKLPFSILDNQILDILVENKRQREIEIYDLQKKNASKVFTNKI